MTYEGLGEMFEGDSADSCVDNFSSSCWGAERIVRRPGSEDPHQHEIPVYFLKFLYKTFVFDTCIWDTCPRTYIPLKIS